MRRRSGSTRFGASGHEWAVRRDLPARMREWARERAMVDGIGDGVVEMGPEGEATHFMAHLDAWLGRYSRSPGEALDLGDRNRRIEPIVRVAGEGG